MSCGTQVGTEEWSLRSNKGIIALRQAGYQMPWPTDHKPMRTRWVTFHEQKWVRSRERRGDGQKGLFPGLSDGEVRTAIFAGEIRAARRLYDNEISGLWFDHKFPDMGEPSKRFKFVTDLADYDDEHVANLLLLATLWPIDTVFNRIRRRMAAFERPVASVSRARRLWHLYAPYEPAMVEKLLVIYRTWHNFVWVSPKTDRTAAELLGLTNGKIRAQDIVYF